MNADPKYAREKLSLAIYELTVGPGDVRSRLRAACKYLTPIYENDFPPELKNDWLNIDKQLNKRKSEFQGTEYDEGTFVATLRRMRNSTGSKIAQQIVELESRLEGWLKDNR